MRRCMIGGAWRGWEILALWQVFQKKDFILTESITVSWMGGQSQLDVFSTPDCTCTAPPAIAACCVGP